MKNFLFHNIQSHLIFDKMLTGTANKQAALVRKTMKAPCFAMSTPTEFNRPYVALEVEAQPATPALSLDRIRSPILPKPVKVQKTRNFSSPKKQQERVSRQFEQAIEYRSKLAARGESMDPIEQARMYERMLPYVEDGTPVYHPSMKYQ